MVQGAKEPRLDQRADLIDGGEEHIEPSARLADPDHRRVAALEALHPDVHVVGRVPARKVANDVGGEVLPPFEDAQGRSSFDRQAASDRRVVVVNGPGDRMIATGEGEQGSRAPIRAAGREHGTGEGEPGRRHSRCPQELAPVDPHRVVPPAERYRASLLRAGHRTANHQTRPLASRVPVAHGPHCAVGEGRSGRQHLRSGDARSGHDGPQRRRSAEGALASRPRRSPGSIPQPTRSSATRPRFPRASRYGALPRPASTPNPSTGGSASRPPTPSPPGPARRSRAEPVPRWPPAATRGP